MSKINVARVIANISNTNIYTPLIEVIVNAIQAIEETNSKDGLINIRIYRSKQQELTNEPHAINGFDVEDNGIGFTDLHRDAFDTLYSDFKLSKGGKGFGRFSYLKYFDEVKITSIYQEGTVFKKRTFAMGTEQNIIVDEKCSISSANKSNTTVSMQSFKGKHAFDRNIENIASRIVEHLLPLFIADNNHCPVINIMEADGSNLICLNKFIENDFIVEIKDIPRKFNITAQGQQHHFEVRLFKKYAFKKSNVISLVAHDREVKSKNIAAYIPEFTESFVDKNLQNKKLNKNYTLAAYVFGNYLDAHVSLERNEFLFQNKNDLMYGISQEDIEIKAVQIVQAAMQETINFLQEDKKHRIQEYVVAEAPWYRNRLAELDLNKIAYNFTDDDIERELNHQQYLLNREIKNSVKKIINTKDGSSIKEEDIAATISIISKSNQDDLIRYVVKRTLILDLFDKSLDTDEKTGNYQLEAVLHNIIFPRGRDSDTCNFEEHNLWIIDEGLNFTSYITSDMTINISNQKKHHQQQKQKRPDLLVYNKHLAFRGENEASNPISIFEFKRPNRDDFTNKSSKEDPIQQIVDYTNEIRAGKHTTPKGRIIKTHKRTPFYGYVICSLTPKVRDWLFNSKNFVPTPDDEGYFLYMSNIYLYIEVLSWEKVLKDAQQRNKIFSHKLGMN